MVHWEVHWLSLSADHREATALFTQQTSTARTLRCICLAKVYLLMQSLLGTRTVCQNLGHSGELDTLDLMQRYNLVSDKSNNEFLLLVVFYLITTCIKASVPNALQWYNGFITSIPPSSVKGKKNYSQYLLKQWDRLYPESLLQWDFEIKNQAWFWIWQKKVRWLGECAVLSRVRLFASGCKITKRLEHKLEQLKNVVSRCATGKEPVYRCRRCERHGLNLCWEDPLK